jgi:hypothetical protein
MAGYRERGPMNRCGLALGMLAALSSCGTETVSFAVDFPSERSFVLTETAEIAIIDADTCSDALTSATSDPELALESVSGSACALRAGELIIESVPHRRVAIVALAFNGAVSPTEPILRGCRMVELRGSPPSVVSITLDFTDDYFAFEAAVVAGGGPGCQTADARCAGSCTP